MKMQSLGAALLVTCVLVLTLPRTVGLQPVYAHALLALTPSPEQSTPAPPPPTTAPAPPTDVPPQPTEAPPLPPTTAPATEVRPTNTPRPSNDDRPEADLVITKQASASEAVIGQVVDFTITVTNKGDGPAGNVVVVDDLPVFLEAVNVSVSRGELAISGRQIQVTLGEVAPGEVITIVLSARIVAIAEPPNNRNTAVFTTSSSSDNKDDNSASTEIRVQPGPSPSPSSSPLPLTPTVAPVPTAPPPVVLPPTGSHGDPAMGGL